MTKLLPDGPIDTQGVLDWITASPRRWTDASEAADSAEVAVATTGPILVLSSGAARIAADAVAALVGSTAPVPVIAHGGPGVPAWVGPETPVLVLGTAGNPEVDAAADAALASGTSPVVIGSGPTVDRLAAAGAPVVSVPAGAGPRFATSSLLAAAVTVCGSMVDPASAGSVDGASAYVSSRLADGRWLDDGRTLARRIGRLLPLVLAAGPIGGVAAAHWSLHLSRTAKVAARALVLPDMVEHELSGWGQHGDVTRQVFSYVSLRHASESSADRRRFPVVEDYLAEVVHARHEVASSAPEPMSALLELMVAGELVAYHLAQELEIDPGPVGVADPAAG